MTRGGRKNKTRKRRTSAPARKTKYVRTYFFFFFFSAFLGVSRQGEFEYTRHEKKIEYVSKKNTGEIFFPGEEFFLGDFSTFFPFDFFVALVKRLSVMRGTQKRDKKVLGGRASIFFPPYRFFFSAFLGVSR
jgi:hypothetical protein